MPSISVQGSLEVRLDEFVTIASTGFSRYGALFDSFTIGGGVAGVVRFGGSSLFTPTAGPSFLTGTIRDVEVNFVDLERLRMGEGINFIEVLTIDGFTIDASNLYTLVSRTSTQASGSLNENILASAFVSKDWTITGSDEDDTISPTSLIELSGNDILQGGLGNDTLNGGSGQDTMSGGMGNDLFIVDNPNDVVEEMNGAGQDTVETSVSFNLNPVSQAIETLTLTGGANISGTGNNSANTVNGNAGNNSLVGAGGDDTLLGNAGADTLIGGTGADVLDGGTGIDSMIGGDGNDLFVVDNLADIVREFANEGIDTIETQVSYNLNLVSQNIEVLSLLGTAFGGIGNGTANTLTGNASNNRLVGAAGNDTLNGAAGNDTLLGGADADRLDGGAGVDRNVGGFGDDTYLVDDFNDRVVEFLSEGLDTVLSTVTFSLLFNSNNIEVLTLQGAGNINGSGNNAANVINGNSGNNVLNGASGFDELIGNGGNDTLNGGFGEDTLAGGAGDDVMNGSFDAQVDTFVFENGFGADVIQNYDFNEDVIDLAAVTGITDFADLDANHLTQVGFNAVITDGINTITILNRNKSSFDADDFNFV